MNRSTYLPVGVAWLRGCANEGGGQWLGPLDVDSWLPRTSHHHHPNYRDGQFFDPDPPLTDDYYEPFPPRSHPPNQLKSKLRPCLNRTQPMILTAFSDAWVLWTANRSDACVLVVPSIYTRMDRGRPV